MKFKILVSVLFGVLFLWVAFSGVEMSALATALRSADWVLLIPFLGMIFVYHILRVWRWSLILQPTYQISFRNLFSINAIGFMAINLLPIRLGEFARPYLLLEKENVPLGAGLASALVERLLDFLAMLLVLALVVFTVDLPTRVFIVGGAEYDLLQVVQRVFLLAALPAVFGLAGLMLFEKWMYKLLHWTVGRVFPAIARRMEGFFREFMVSLRPLRTPRMLLIQTLLTLAIWSLAPLSEWLMFRVFHLDHLGFDAALTVVAALLIGMLIPAPPGFAGTFEAFTMAGLAIYGVTGGVALGYALLLHWVQFFQVFLMGMYFLYRDHISFTSLIRLGKDLRTDLRATH